MPSYRAEAIVLRTHKLGEADRIITLLTRERGKIRAVAKGVRRTKSKFGARLEPFSRVDLLVFEGKSLDIITQAESLNAYGQDLALDYSLWTAGQTMLETADRLTSEESISAESQYLLLVGALRTLVSGEHASSLVLDAYLLRSLSMAGYSPTLNACVICGVAGTQPFFHVSTGGALCVEHRVPGSVAPRPESFELMQALMTGDWEAADAAAGKDRNEVSGIVAAYVQWHLERGLRSLPLVDRQAT
ncbi:MAG: repair protein RecO [Actinomycetota bacterium]|jgi:DNA repair protein RecO (recombination protein O)